MMAVWCDAVVVHACGPGGNQQPVHIGFDTAARSPQLRWAVQMITARAMHDRTVWRPLLRQGTGQPEQRLYVGVPGVRSARSEGLQPQPTPGLARSAIAQGPNLCTLIHHG